MGSLLRNVAIVPGSIGSDQAQRLLEQGFALVINAASDADQAEAVADAFRRSHRAAMIVDEAGE